MSYYFLIFFLFFPPAYSYDCWDDDDDLVYCYCDDYDNFESDDNPEVGAVTYGSMTFLCDYGCGDPNCDPSFRKISYILKDAIRKVFSCCSPLDLDWDSLGFLPWKRKRSCTYNVYDWEMAKGFYLPEPPKKEYSFTNYSQFLELASALRQDVRFYSLDVYGQALKFYRSIMPGLQQLKREVKYGNISFYENGELDLKGRGTFSSTDTNIREFTKNLRFRIEYIEKRISDLYPSNYEKNKEIIEDAIQKVDNEFRDIFIWCFENHQPEGIAFHGAVEELIAQDFYQAIDQIRWLIEILEKSQLQDDLFSKLYFLKGQIQSEYGLFAEAIIGLTTAIHKNPQMKEAYFERAASYFELGQFDRAIEDYLASGIRPSYYESPSQLGLGIATGIAVGAKASTLEFIPTMIGTAQGLGSGIWALLKSPVAASQEFVNAASQCVEYLRAHSTLEVIQDMVPELRELIQNDHQFTDFQKGKLIGHVIGKYGIDILLAKQSVAFLKSYQNLKKANKVLTLDALTSSGTAQTILAETEQRWSNIHIEAIRKGEVKIAEAKQGKHILGHKNYKALIADNKNPSILTHANPQKLLNEYGGTGIKGWRASEPTIGFDGYIEIVDFQQFIGYSVARETGIKTATTMGKIHYAKEGAHIVPFIHK